MKNMKHTPGPWSINSQQVWAPKQATVVGHAVATIEPSFKGSATEANARLIAAAPELLEALKMALSYITRPTMQDRDCAERLATLAHIQDVIDEATGGPE